MPKKSLNIIKVSSLAKFLGKSTKSVSRMLKAEYHQEDTQLLLNYYIPIFVKMQIAIFEKDLEKLNKLVKHEKYRERTRKIREENRAKYDKIKRSGGVSRGK